MKKIIFVVIALISVVNFTFAQKKEINELKGTYIQPETSIVVELVVKRESVVKGPYSRYANQLLGVVAPLNDKEAYSIEAVKIKGTNYGSMSNVAMKGGEQKAPFQNGNIMFGSSDEQFKDLSITPIYTESGGEKSLKTMATDAASVIFKLRQRRMDLITGESGERVFGEGLKVALEEIARIEKEYLELFLGKNRVEYLTYQYEIVPENGKDNYIVCRFDKNSGIMNGVKITGTPVVLSVIGEKKIVLPQSGKKKAEGNTTRYAVADVAKCKVSVGETILAERRLPVLQFGVIAEDIVNQPSK